MKRTGLVLFVVFYFVATIVVNGERSANVADRVGHSSAPEFAGVESPHASIVQHLPYFSHAKKVKPALADIGPEPFGITRIFTSKFDDGSHIEYVSCDPETHRSRAPPALT